MSAAGFTKKEEALLTALDAVAHDILRVENGRRGEIAPCWLVVSEETRAVYRQKVVDFANENSILPVFNIEHAARQFERLISPALVAKWRAAELEAKCGRAANEPRAFFT